MTSFVASGCSSTGTSVPTTAFTARLDQTLTDIEHKYDIAVGVRAIDPQTGVSYSHRGDDRFGLCSTFKVYAAAKVLEMARNGDVSLDQQVDIRAEDVVDNSAVLATKVGDRLPLRDIVAAALMQSDNAAGNILLKTIGGPGAIAGIAREFGDRQTRLDRWEPELNDVSPTDTRDTTTPNALAAGYQTVLLDGGLKPEDRTLLVGWMRDNVTSTKRIRAGLPAGWTSADKTGAGKYGIVNDAGIVWNRAGEPLVLVILTRSKSANSDAPNRNEAVAETTRAVVEALR